MPVDVFIPGLDCRADFGQPLLSLGLGDRGGEAAVAGLGKVDAVCPRFGEQRFGGGYVGRPADVATAAWGRRDSDLVVSVYVA